MSSDASSGSGSSATGRIDADIGEGYRGATCSMEVPSSRPHTPTLLGAGQDRLRIIADDDDPLLGEASDAESPGIHSRGCSSTQKSRSGWVRRRCCTAPSYRAVDCESCSEVAPSLVPICARVASIACTASLIAAIAAQMLLANYITFQLCITSSAMELVAVIGLMYSKSHMLD